MLFAKVRKSLLVSLAVLSLAVFASAGTVSAAPAKATYNRPSCSAFPGTINENDLGQIAFTVQCKNLIPTAVYYANDDQIAYSTYGDTIVIGNLFPSQRMFADLNGRLSFSVVTTLGTVPGKYWLYLHLTQPPFTSVAFQVRVLSPRD